MDLRVISIGTMPANPLWGEKAGSALRTGHATTTLIRSGKRVILVDPGLPAQVIVARLAERANVKPAEVTHIFLTSFKPDTRRGITAFQDSVWWISETEREGMGVPLVRRLKEAAEQGDEELRSALELDVAILKRCEPAPDRLAERVDLFPLHGVTPGSSGVLVGGPGSGVGAGTALICGDAVPTVEHLEHGMIMHGAADVHAAQESFREAIEIADILVLGRDNWVVNPVRRGY
jgi:glyoxylase-like metal-dependent hydrolase (beta-lactamase superfamily II)